MAALESTTPLPPEVKLSETSSLVPAATFESRFLTVGNYTPSSEIRPGMTRSPKPRASMSYLRLLGRWLGEAGFPIGTKVRVEVSPSCSRAQVC
jgi:Toxin SymE, type I toxin-antitoxin system